MKGKVRKFMLSGFLSLLVGSCGSGNSTFKITGKVVSSSIKGLEVCISETTNCTLTGEDGSFVLWSTKKTPKLSFFLKGENQKVKLGEYQLKENSETITPDKITGNHKTGELLAKLLHSLNADYKMEKPEIDLTNVVLELPSDVSSITELLNRENFTINFSYNGNNYSITYANNKVKLCEPQEESCQEVKYNREWLILIYMNGDNDLDSFADEDLAELSRVKYTPKVKVVVLRDSFTTYGYTVYVSDETTGQLKELLKSSEEIDMGSPSTLVNFVREYARRYPAKKIALIMWNHGNGWRNISSFKIRATSYDQTTNNYLYMFEFTEALKKLKKEGISFNLIGFDECLMGGLEVLADIKDYAQVFVASEKTEGPKGWDYSLIMKSLTQKPTADPYTFGKIIVDAYKDTYGSRNQNQNPGSFTLTLFRKEDIETLLQAINSLAEMLDKGNKDIFKEAREEVLDLADDPDNSPNYVDLKDLAEKLAERGLSSEALNVIKTTIENLYSALINTELNGIYIYFPKDSSDYSKCYSYTSESPSSCSFGSRVVNNYYNPFAEMSKWDEMLVRYFELTESSQ